MEALWEALRSVRVVDLIDIGLVAGLIWLTIIWLQATRARAALAGLAILGAIYLVANQFDLQLTSWILQAFFATSVIVVVVVFQEDIRRFFEQLARVGRSQPQRNATDALDHLVRAVARLAHDHHGALVVFPGEDSLDRHLDGGIALEARLSEPLLLSLFDPSSPGHDGAIVMEGDRIARFAVHLPLSTDHDQLGQRGTRHAAALGLSERTDALCLVVSEERGTVSVAQAGLLRTLERPELASAVLRDFLFESSGAGDERSSWRRVLGRWREAGAAGLAATLFWVLAVPGASPVEVERDINVNVVDLPAQWVLEGVEPSHVTVVLSAPRRDLVLLGEDDVGVQINAVLAELGRRTFAVGPEQVSVPRGVEVLSVEPENVKLSLRRGSRN